MRARPRAAADRRGRFGEPPGMCRRAGLHFLALRPLKLAQVSQRKNKKRGDNLQLPVYFILQNSVCDTKIFVERTAAGINRVKRYNSTVAVSCVVETQHAKVCLQAVALVELARVSVASSFCFSSSRDDPTHTLIFGSCDLAQGTFPDH